MLKTKKEDNTPVDTTDPESLKEAGNKAFAKKELKKAVDYFTQAIELTTEKPSHIYFANRAFAYLQMGLLVKCIADCNMAINIDPDFPKSYYRKARAQIGMQNIKAALETLDVGLEKCPGNEDLVMM